MSTQLPQDDLGRDIPALAYRAGGAHTVAPAGGSARNAAPFDPSTKVVTVRSTADVRFRQGGTEVTATATDHFLPAGTDYDIATKGQPHIAFYGNATVYVSERE